MKNNSTFIKTFLFGIFSLILLLMGAYFHDNIRKSYLYLFYNVEIKKTRDNNIASFDTQYHRGVVTVINLQKSLKDFLNDPEFEIDSQMVSDQILSDQIHLLLSDGKLLKINQQGQILEYLDLVKYLPDFSIVNKGIDGGYWIDSKNVLVYHLSEINGSFAMSLTWLQVDDNKISYIDHHTFGQLTEDETVTRGGGMLSYKKGLIIATGSHAIEIGTKSQDDNSNYGKVIFIDIKTIKMTGKFKEKDFKIIAKGLRNPYGIVYSNNRYFLTDHGHSGGDMISEIIEGGNFGRTLFDYGRAYDPELALLNNKPKNYIEPLFYFNPAIAPSDISSCPFPNKLQGYGNCLVVSSLRAESMFILKTQNSNPIIQSIEQIDVGERIRRIETIDTKVFLFTDDMNIYIINYIPDYVQ
jgi:hypothetical protein